MRFERFFKAFLKMFECFSMPFTCFLNVFSVLSQFIFDACMRNCVEIGKHKHGCCVMQRCLEKGTKKQKLELAEYIIEYMPSLIEDPYGNYLVQNVIKLNDT